MSSELPPLTWVGGEVGCAGGGPGDLAPAVATPSASVSPSESRGWAGSEVPNPAPILQPVSDPFLYLEPGGGKWSFSRELADFI